MFRQLYFWKDREKEWTFFSTCRLRSVGFYWIHKLGWNMFRFWFRSIQTHPHTYTQKEHTHINTHIQSLTHTHTETHTQRVDSYKHTLTHTHTHTHTHTGADMKRAMELQTITKECPTYSGPVQKFRQSVNRDNHGTSQPCASRPCACVTDYNHNTKIEHEVQHYENYHNEYSIIRHKMMVSLKISRGLHTHVFCFRVDLVRVCVWIMYSIAYPNV